MSISSCLRAGLIVTGLCFFAVAVASEKSTVPPNIEHKFDLAKKYYGECAATDEADFEQIRPYLAAFADMNVMADTLANPARFAKLMSIVSDPRTIHVMSKCATEPVMWDTWMRGMTDWQGMMQVMMKFSNPAIYMNWMMAPMNPATYQPMMQMMNPAWYGHWMTAMGNPAFYQPMFSMADPNWYLPRLHWMMNPSSYQPLFNAFHMPYMAPQGKPGAKPEPPAQPGG